jgi:hypothetical protein
MRIPGKLVLVGGWQRTVGLRAAALALKGDEDDAVVGYCEGGAERGARDFAVVEADVGAVWLC